jgi:hypothetical protein
MKHRMYSLSGVIVLFPGLFCPGDFFHVLTIQARKTLVISPLKHYKHENL